MDDTTVRHEAVEIVNRPSGKWRKIAYTEYIAVAVYEDGLPEDVGFFRDRAECESWIAKSWPGCTIREGIAYRLEPIPGEIYTAA